MIIVSTFVQSIYMNSDVVPVFVSLFICGLFFTFTGKKYLINLIKSTNKVRLIKFAASDNTVGIMRLMGIGALIIGTVGLIAVIFRLV